MNLLARNKKCFFNTHCESEFQDMYCPAMFMLKQIQKVFSIMNI